MINKEITTSIPGGIGTTASATDLSILKSSLLRTLKPANGYIIYLNCFIRNIRGSV
jgi:hypothetical protein